ncbi:MAG: SRPBCC family protein [Bacteroidales bacterium]|nr:SRPBCC family protein [Bacteroidales bacterium]
MKDLRKYYSIPATAEDIYIALTNPVTIQLWTGEPAVMSTEPGSEFSLWDGSITGRNIEFQPGTKLVQQWYFGEQPEESIVTIILHPKGEGTSVELIHTNIPDEDFDDIADGWNNSYFGSLREFYRD